MRVMIDGVRHHKCDWCKRDFTQEAADHITIEIGERSGLARLHQTLMPGWRFVRLFKPRYIDFCVPQYQEENCVNLFFASLVERNNLPEYVEGLK